MIRREKGVEIGENGPVFRPSVDEKIDVQSTQLVPEGVFRRPGEGQDEQGGSRAGSGRSAGAASPRREDPGGSFPSGPERPPGSGPSRSMTSRSRSPSFPVRRPRFFSDLGQIPDDQSAVAFGAGLPLSVRHTARRSGLRVRKARQRLSSAWVEAGGGRFLDPGDLVDELGDLSGKTRGAEDAR